MSKMQITEHNDHSVEYEIEAGSEGERCYVAFTKAGNLFYVSTQTEFDEVEECITYDQARHLYKWLGRQLQGPGVGMDR